jgi:hypothetical protein
LINISIKALKSLQNIIVFHYQIAVMNLTSRNLLGNCKLVRQQNLATSGA